MREINNIQYPIYDFHSHILPSLDDGAKDVTVAERLLRMSAEMGIDGIVATPHFYATECKPEDFLRKRAESAELLMSVYDERQHPALYLGAEVAYFYGIGTARDLHKLAIAGTNLILIEMPYTAWNESILTEIQDIRDRLNLRPIIAHMERYIKLQSNRVLRRVYEMELDLQFSADFLADGGNRKIIKKLLAQDAVHLLGSDCHNTTSRTQNLMDGITMLLQYSEGLDALERISKRSEAYIAKACKISTGAI